MGVLGDEAFRWELDDNRWEYLLCDDVPLGVDVLGVGEFRDRECWDPDLYKGCDPEGEFVREEYKGWDPELEKGWDPDADGEFRREEYKGWDPDPDKG